MRPAQDSDGARILDFYLPEEEDVAQVDQMLKEPLSNERVEELTASGQLDDENFKPVSLATGSYGMMANLGQNVRYERIRSYEMATVQEAVGKEMLLTIVEPESAQNGGDGEPSKKKRKGAYITPIASKILLRKTRAKVRIPTSSSPLPLLMTLVSYADPLVAQR